jgi:hypothetical protein
MPSMQRTHDAFAAAAVKVPSAPVRTMEIYRNTIFLGRFCSGTL